MKHLSEVPRPPSELRPEVPHDLDSVVLRALAKDPVRALPERRGDGRRPGTRSRGPAGRPGDRGGGDRGALRLRADGRRADLRDRTTPPPAQPSRPAPPGATPPAGYYGYEGPPRRRRPVWPWVLSVLLLLAAAGAAWFAYTKIQDQLNANKPVSVPLVRGHGAAGGRRRSATPGSCRRSRASSATRSRRASSSTRARTPGEKLAEERQRRHHGLEGQGDRRGAQRDREDRGRCGEHAHECRAWMRRPSRCPRANRWTRSPARTRRPARWWRRAARFESTFERAGRRARALGDRAPLRPGERRVAGRRLRGVA